MSTSSSGIPRLNDFQVLIFDVFGTLVDWEGGIYQALLPLLSSVDSQWTRKEALAAFGSVETDLQARYPTMKYAELLAKSFDVLQTTLNAPAASSDRAEASARFAQSINDWLPFPDTSDALRVLAEHYKLVALSNVDRESFAFPLARLSESSTENVAAYTPPSLDSGYWFPQKTAGSQSPFTLIITAEDTHAYKPDLTGFNKALELIEAEFGVPQSKVLVVAQSLFHDHRPANLLGLSSVWIDRANATMGLNVGSEPPHWAWRFETLGEMAAAVRKEE